MNRAHLERLDEALTRLEDDLGACDTQVCERTRGVGAVIRGLAVAIGILALTNLYFVNALTEEVKLMTLAMQEMTGHFGNVAERMQTLTGTIDGMDRSVALMPVIRDQMDAIGGQVDRMSRDVAGLRGTTARMDGRMDALNAGVFDMSQRFRGLNRSVAGMGADVDQMARPIP